MSDSADTSRIDCGAEISAALLGLTMTIKQCEQCGDEMVSDRCNRCYPIIEVAEVDYGEPVVTVSTWACYLVSILLAFLTMGVWICIARGGEPDEQTPVRVEYYTLDDGTRVPFTGDYTAHHQYQRLGKTTNATVAERPSKKVQRKINRPEVRQTNPTNTTRTINARVAVGANISSTNGSPTASMFIDAKRAVRRGDTKP